MIPISWLLGKPPAALEGSDDTEVVGEVDVKLVDGIDEEGKAVEEGKKVDDDDVLVVVDVVDKAEVVDVDAGGVRPPQVNSVPNGIYRLDVSVVLTG